MFIFNKRSIKRKICYLFLKIGSNLRFKISFLFCWCSLVLRLQKIKFELSQTLSVDLKSVQQLQL